MHEWDAPRFEQESPRFESGASPSLSKRGILFSRNLPMKRIPLYSVLTIPFVLQTLGAVGIVGFLSWQNGQKVVNNLVNQITQQADDRIQQRLQQYLEMPRIVTQLNVEAIATQHVDVNQPADLTQHFWMTRSLFRDSKVSAIYYGTADGSFTGLGLQQNNRWEASRVSPETAQLFRSYTIDALGNPLAVANIGKRYDPRTRPWYKLVQNKTGASWIPIYPDFKELRLKLTFAQPIRRNGKLQGVVGADFVLDHIAKFLASLKLSQNGEVFIVERSGQIIAASDLQQPTANKQGRIQAVTAKHPAIRETMQYLQSQPGGLARIQSAQTFKLAIAQEQHWIQITPFQDSLGLDWLIIVAIPESDFMAEITANSYTTLWLCLGTLGLALILGSLSARWMSAPLKHLSVASQKIAGGEWNQTVTAPRIEELMILADSFNRMSHQIQESRQQLENSVELLEVRVAERTKDLDLKNQTLEATLTQLQTAQDQLIQSEKLAALGQLVAGVAHEMNTPLAAIQSSIGNIKGVLTRSLPTLLQFLNQLSADHQQLYFQLLQRATTTQAGWEKLSSRDKRQLKKQVSQQLLSATQSTATNLTQEEAYELSDQLVEVGIWENFDDFKSLLSDRPSRTMLSAMLKSIHQLVAVQKGTQLISTASDRATKVVFALKRYAHQQQHFSDAPHKSLTNVIESIETTLTLYQHQTKQVEIIRQYHPIPTIFSFSDELHQVWTNLIHNALSAMDYQGTLTITTNTNTNNNDTIMISITDTGSGISPDVQAKIFDPFFTTKAMGEGTGLGLCIVKQIIDHHQGAIAVTSQPGHTTFCVSLPTDNSS
jgi:C4-dicarboxylate-specific signal transduction histidine kinase